MKKSLVVAGASAVLLGLCLSGCAPATTGPAAGSSPAPVGASAAPSKPPVATAGKHIDICVAVPLAKVASLTGKAYVTTKDTRDQKAQGLDASACGYNGVDDSLTALSITIFYGTPSTAWTFMTGEDSSLGTPMTTNVPGLGDRAMTDGSDDLAVQYGSDVIEVQDLAEGPGAPLVPLDQMKQLVGLTHSAMQ